MSEANANVSGSPLEPVVQTREERVGPTNPHRSDDVPFELWSKHATLESITDAGWQVAYSSSGAWWWERVNPETGKKERMHCPYWVHQLINQAAAKARRDMQDGIAAALGVQRVEKSR